MSTISIGHLQLLYSGAASVDESTSLGEAISATVVTSQTFTAPVNLVEVNIINSFNCPLGAGTLGWLYATSQLSWQPNGDAVTYYVNVDSTGVYTIGTASTGLLVVDVTDWITLSSRVADDSDTITISAKVNGMFDDVSSLQSLNGLIEYRCFFVKNSHPTAPILNIAVWLNQQPTGPDSLDLALDTNFVTNGAGSAGSPQNALGPLQDEKDSTNILAGVTWKAPATYAQAKVGGALEMSIGTLQPGEYYAFWLRRAVPAETYTSAPNDASIIAFAGFF